MIALDKFINAASFAYRWSTTAQIWKHNLYPNSFKRIRTDLTSIENQKLEQIKKTVRSVADRLGISQSTNLSAGILKNMSKNIGVLGSIPFLSNLKIVITEDYFKNYKLKCDANSKEELEWKKFLAAAPDDPIRLGQFLDQLDLETRNRLQQLAKKYTLILEEDELQGMIAHELGHARHNHALVKFAIRGLFLYEILNEPHLEAIQTDIPLLLQKLSMICLMVFFSPYLSRRCETEADLQTSISSEYLEGLILNLKKELILELTQDLGSSHEEKAKNLLHNADYLSSHPNDAKRMINLIELRDKPYTPPSLLSSIGERLIPCISLLLIARDIYSLSLPIFQFL